MKIFIAILSIIIILGFSYYFFTKLNRQPNVNNSPSSKATISSGPEITPANKYNLAEPIAEFKQRITKKTFGMYIMPATSPVQPERFTGYHTGVDVEYTDITNDVSVYAIADGTITYSGWVTGYGGVIILKVDIGGAPHSILYGHLRPSSLPSVATNFKKSDQVAVLGTGFSTETDGERRHLHFGILSDDRIDLKGYLTSQSQLSGWIEPKSLY